MCAEEPRFLSIEHDPRFPLTSQKGKEGPIAGHITSEYSPFHTAAVEACVVTSIAIVSRNYMK
jgi:hypothetical protein